VIVLDTNVLSALMRKTPEAPVVAWLDRQPPESVWITSVTLFEVRFGLALLPRGRRRQGLEAAFDLMSEGIVIHDAETRVVMFNEAMRQMHPRMADAMPRGATLEEVLRKGLENGEWDVEPEQWDDWIAERRKLYEKPESETIIRTREGRVILSRSRRSPDR